MRVSTLKLTLLVVCGSATAAIAYPQFQLSTGNGRCGSCHISPAGGGLLNDWGRDESADTISMGDSESFAGDPGVLYGAWTPPDWFKFGMDYRGAAIVKSGDSQDTELLAFPMQADLYTHFKTGKGISINLTLGLRGAARGSEQPELAQRFVSREHYIMYKPEDEGFYARVGRFHAPYGLRLQDHTSYIRRRLGFHILEEPYTASVGISRETHDLHASFFVPSPVFQAGKRVTGGALMYEKRIRGGSAAWGVQSKVATSALDLTQQFGATYKYYFEDNKLLLLSELDLGYQYVRANGAPRTYQATSHVGLNYFVKPYLIAGGALEYHDSDIKLEGTARTSASATIQFFPRSHLELMWLSRLELQDHSYGNQIHMFMLHYYL